MPQALFLKAHTVVLFNHHAYKFDNKYSIDPFYSIEFKHLFDERSFYNDEWSKSFN